MISAIIRRYLDDGFWTVVEAAEYAPEPDGDVIDSTAVLAHVLTEQMTVPAAREFVRRTLQQPQHPRSADRPSRRRGERRRNELLIRATECLLTQEPPNESDLRLLVPLADLSHNEGYEFLGQLDFTTGFVKCTALRRELYLRELDTGTSSQTEVHRREFRWRMQADDIEWFIEQLPKLAEKNDQVWDDFLVVAFSPSTPSSLGRRAKWFVKSQCPERLAAFRANRKKSLRAPKAMGGKACRGECQGQAICRTVWRSRDRRATADNRRDHSPTENVAVVVDLLRKRSGTTKQR